MTSPYALQKRSFAIGKRKTSVSVEDRFWSQLKTLAKKRGKPINHMVDEIDHWRAGKTNNLSSAIRVYMLEVLLEELVQAGQRQEMPLPPTEQRPTPLALSRVRSDGEQRNDGAKPIRLVPRMP